MLARRQQLPATCVVRLVDPGQASEGWWGVTSSLAFWASPCSRYTRYLLYFRDVSYFFINILYFFSRSRQRI